MPTRTQLTPVVEPGGAVDADLCLERLCLDVAGARPDIRDAPDPVLEPAVGIADHRGIEAGAGHHAEPLPVHPANVDRTPRAVETGLHGGLDVRRDAEIRGEQVRGPRRHDRKRRPCAREHVEAALDGAVAAPREDELRALLEGLLHPPGRLAALRDLVPERVVDPGFLEDAAQLDEAAADRLARVRDDCDAHQRASAVSRRGHRSTGHAAGEHHDHDRRDADRNCRERVDRMVHAPVDAGQRHDRRDRDRDHPNRYAPGAAREPRREEDGEPAVQGDRRGRVPGRVARVDRERLEPHDVGPSPLDEQRGHTVRRGFDGDREEDVRGDPPLAQDRHDKPDQAECDGDHIASGQLGPHPGGVRPAAGAIACEPGREALVEALDGVDVEQDVGDEQTERDRDHGEQEVAGDKCKKERQDRMTVAQDSGEPLCWSSGPRLEERDLVPGTLLPLPLCRDRVRR